MFKSDRKSIPLICTSLPAILVLLILAMPMTVACQRNQPDSGRGLEELRALVAGSAGRPAASDLVRIETRFPRTRAAALARFLRGYLYFAANNYQAAIDALDPQLISAHSSIGDYALYFRAQSEAMLDAKSEALRDYGILYTKHPNSLMARDARLRAAELAVAQGDPGGAIKELARMVDSDDADALYITAQAYESMGKPDQATRLYRRIYYELPATGASVKAEPRLAALGLAPGDNPGSFEDERSRADGLFTGKQYAEAARAYDNLIARFPESGRNDQIQLRRGISLLNAKLPAQSLMALSAVSARDPELYTAALFHQAEALRRSNRAAESAAIVDRLLSQYPKSRQTQEALYNLANYYEKQERNLEAALRFRQLVSTYPTSEYAPQASYEIGWQAYQGRNYTEAARVLQHHLANYRYPQTKFIGEAGFWAAKSEERLGNRARALTLYELVSERYRYGYHGYVAGLRARALRAADAKLKAEQAKAGSDLERIRRNILHVEKVQETADGSEADYIARADELELTGLSDMAVKELNQGLATAPTSPRINLRLAQLYSRRGENFQATLTLRRGYPDLYSYDDADLPREAWEIFFPLAHWDTIKQEARRYGIDPYIAAGLIRQESVFNPNAISRVGARGLMQLMPSTGQLVAKRQGVGRVTTGDLFNPTLNIKLGMSYLADMLGQLGRIEYAAAGYNAGPGRAKRWVADRGSMDIEDWIESIPFSETRGYVQGVIRYAANYRRFYKE